MGGVGGEVRGRTKEEAWIKLQEEVRPDVEDRYSLFLEAPLTREAAWNNMWQDADSGWWVLDYYFSK